MAFDYASRDYSTIKSDLLARASRVAPEWTDRDASDFGMVLVDLWAQMGDVLHYYVDRAAGESFLPTATQRESVLAFANLFDYDPASRTSAAATVTLRNNGSTAITLPKYTRFIARYDNVTYQAYAPEEEVLSPNSSTVIGVLEGTIVSSPSETLTNSSSGIDSQRYRIANKNVVKDSVVITVYEDGVTPTEYRRVIRLSDARLGERVFVLSTNANGFIEVLFGTSTRGFVPPSNSVITATYAYSSGSTGNLPANSVTAFRDSTPQGVVIVSSSSFTGGSDSESIVSMRNTIPSIISSQNRAVTINDYINLSLGIEGVQKVAVQYLPNPAGGASAGNASVMVFPQVDRSADYLTTADVSQTVSFTLKDIVTSTLQPKSIIGVDVVCADTVEWDPIYLTATVQVLDSYVARYVERDVINAIDSLLSFSTVRFGQTLSLGQFYRAIMSVEGVDYANISQFNNDEGASVESTIMIDPYELPKKGTVTLSVFGGITSVI
jgi:hypothetical protein